jgi:hypothetical protein
VVRWRQARSYSRSRLLQKRQASCARSEPTQSEPRTGCTPLTRAVVSTAVDRPQSCIQVSVAPAEQPHWRNARAVVSNWRWQTQRVVRRRVPRECSVDRLRGGVRARICQDRRRSTVTGSPLDTVQRRRGCCQEWRTGPQRAESSEWFQYTQQSGIRSTVASEWLPGRIRSTLCMRSNQQPYLPRGGSATWGTGERAAGHL